MRLNNKLRAEIVRRILCEAFGKRHEALRKKIDAYVTRCYRKEFDAEIQIANGIPRERADVMLKQWSGCVDLEVAGKAMSFLSRIGSLSSTDDATIAYRYKFGTLLQENYKTKYKITRLVHGNALFDEGLELYAEIEEFNNQHEALYFQVRGILNSCYTTKKLLELLPEAEPYIPKPDVPSTQALVSVDILNSVRAVLQQNKAT